MNQLPDNVSHLACMKCDFTTTDPWQWDCPRCGHNRVDVVFEPSAADALGAADLSARRFDMWRYRETLPLPAGAPSLPISTGGTPVVDAPRLAQTLDVARCVLKDDGRNPSGSLKDRPSSLGVVLALAAGKDRIVCASTGNAASSTACAAASVGLPATIFVPRRAPLPKVAQLKMFGATVLRVDADYDTTWDLCASIAADKPWFNRNCAHNPYLVEGKKTAALELCDQLRDRMCDWVVYSVGDGCTIAGAAKGLIEAHQAGLIPFVPRLLGVQAQGARPLVDAFEQGREDFVPGPADSVADSIAVGHPRNGHKALRYVAKTNGSWVAADDALIMQAALWTAQRGGVFGEPAAAAATAGVKVARDAGIIQANESVAILVSGNGLKDAQAAIEAAGPPLDVPADKAAVLAALGEG